MLSPEAKAQLTEVVKRAEALFNEEDDDLTLATWRCRAIHIVLDLSLAVKNLQLEVIRLGDRTKEPHR